MAFTDSYHGTLRADNPFGLQQICFEFYYYFFSTVQANFVLEADTTVSLIPIFRSYSSNEIKWKRAIFTETPKVNYTSFIMNSYIRNGIFAIDDINVRLGACAGANTYCDFEQTTCIFEPISNSVENWKVFQAESLNIPDHTTHSMDGHYYGMQLKMATNGTVKQTFATQAKQIDGTKIRCLRFSYLLASLHPSTGLFYDIKQNGKPIVKRWQTAGNTLGIWFTHRMGLPAQSQFDIQIGIETVGEVDGKVLLDDIYLDSVNCDNPHSCDFESGDVCTLEAVPYGGNTLQSAAIINLASLAISASLTTKYLTNYVQQVWFVYSPEQSQTTSKYIEYDNTLGKSWGKYLLLTSDGREYKRAIMITERYSFAGHGQVCLSFALCKASKLSVFEIYQGESFSDSFGMKLWDFRQVTNGWETFQIVATPQNNTSIDIYFFIIGTLQDPSAYLALDDIMIKPSSCDSPSNPSQASSSAHTMPNPLNAAYECSHGAKIIPIAKVCDWVTDCQDGEDERDCGECNFEDFKMCRYSIQNAHGNGYIFKFRDQSTIGPLASGFYHDTFFMLASGTTGSSALISPIIHQSYADCRFYFYYNFFSNGVSNNLTSSELTVSIELTDLSRRRLIWQSSFERIEKSYWRQVYLYLGRIDHPFRIIFSATNSDNKTAKNYHAIDYFKLSNCAPKMPSSSCYSGYFKCDNRVCVEPSLRCNFVDNCGDGSDERNCDTNLMTSFEYGRGRWGANIFKGWSVTTSVNNFTNLRLGPTYDHTTGFSLGSFLYTSARYFGSNRTVISEIDSPPFVLNYGCTISYYVFRNCNDRQSTLLMILQNLNTGKKYIPSVVNEDNSASWSLYSSDFGRYPTDLYRVILTASLNATSGSFVDPYIAIDDISFTSGCILTTSTSFVHPTQPKHSQTMTTPVPDNCPVVSCLSTNGTKVCLRSRQLCDFVVDCADGTDELHCGECKFDSGLCGWSPQHGSLDWFLMQPASSSPALLPKQDADGKGTGGYITVHGDKSEYNACIQSPQINGQTAATCEIQFAFSSTNGARLNVIIITPDERTNIYSIQTASPWRTYRAEIGTQTDGFRIQFQGQSTNISNLFHDIVLDNFQIIDCNPYTANSSTSPGATLSCDFEQDLCGWRIVGSSQRSNWFRSSNPSIEPGNDHTSLSRQLSTQYGTWLTSQANFVAETDYLVAVNRLKANATYCLSFWYYYLGIDVDSYMALFVLKSDNVSLIPKRDANYRQFWTTNMPDSRNWIQQYVLIDPQKSDFYLMFVASVNTDTIVGIDDIELAKGKCTVTNSEFCDFEVNTCDWRMDGWQRNANSSKAKYIDHTTGTLNGHYLEDTMQGQAVSINKHMSTMPSFKVDKSSTYKFFCMQFYYYMSTDLVDNQMKDNASMLTVKVKDDYGHIKATQNVTILDTFNDGFLSVWTLFSFPFFANRASAIQIQGLSMHPSSRILIDDIRFTQRLCQIDGRCDFEADMCGWSNVHTTSFGKQILWLRIQPNSKFIKGHLLKYDHTTMNTNGNYLIMPLAMATNGPSVLKSSLIRKNTRSTVCFSMWYFAQARQSNASVAALTVRLVDITRRKTTDVQVNGTRTLAWTQFSVQFRNLPSAFVIEIETVSNIREIQSDIGLDDIRLDGCIDRTGTSTTTQIPLTERALDCNFDTGECNWSYDKNSWTVGSFLNKQNIYAPKMDHTLQTSDGKYLMFQRTGDQNSVTTATHMLTSTKNVTFDKDHCISLWYYEDSEVPFTLDVYIVLPTFVAPVSRYSSAIENQKRWNLLKGDIPYSSSYNVTTIQVQIRFTTLSSQKLLIFALDDIVVKPGKCQHQHDYVYTFTGGLEDLELEVIQPIQDGIGQLYRPSSVPNPPPSSLAPSVDHTTNSPDGQYFLFANLKTLAPTTYIDTLSLLDLPRDDAKRSSCIRFAYQISGNVTLKLFVAPINANTYYYYTKSEQILWNPKFAKTTWTIMEINKRIQFVHKLVFYMEKGCDKPSYLALDDITVLSHQCQDVINCDFEDGRVCSYAPIVSDNSVAQYNFGLFQAPTQDPNWPGPKYDHTTKNYGGGYLYLTAYRSTGAKELHSKIISGPRAVDPTKQYCLTLWTRITSSDLALSIHLIRFGSNWYDNNRTLLLVNMQKSTQPDWTLVALILDQNMLVDTNEVQLFIEGTIGANSTGLIAIDDIVFMEGSQCQSDGLLCENGLKLTREKICNFIKDCPSGLDEVNCGDCDFESGTCGWMNMTTYDQKWLLTNAKESQNANAPTSDGNINPKGHYLLMSRPSFGVASNAETALNYPTPSMYLKNAFKSCTMQFDYFIQTSITDVPSVQVRIGRDRVDWATIYTITHHQQSKVWRKANIYIGHRYTQFMVDIVGHLDLGLNGIMAIDNIRFANCSMPKPLEPSEHCSNKDEFMCKNRQFCVSQDDICDYVNDCGDGSDEIGCINWALGCNFESSLSSCAIKTGAMMMNPERIKPTVEWNLKTGQLNRDYCEPTVDNTRHDGYGKYLVLEPVKQFDQNKVEIGEFYTPMLTSKSDQNCRMRFFYFVNCEFANNSNKIYIEIYIQYAKNIQPELQPLIRLSIDSIQTDLLQQQQQRWIKAVTQFQSTEPFQFVLRASLGTKESRIALDDISYDQNCVSSSVTAQSLTTSTTTPMDNNNSRVTKADQITLKPPTANREKNNSSKGKIIAAILVPLFAVLIAVGAFFGYRKYRESRKNDCEIIISMKGIKDDH